MKEISKPPTPRVVLRMDDAVSVLYSLSLATNQALAETSRNYIEAMVQERVHKALLSYGVGLTEPEARNKPSPSSSRPKKTYKRKQSSSGASKDKSGNVGRSERPNKRTHGFCWECGSPEHFRNSKDCSFNGGETYIDKMHRLAKGSTDKKKSSDAFFSQGLYALERQSSLIVRRGAKRFIPWRDDPNPVVDVGCPRNVGVIPSAVLVASALGIPFKLRPLDREPF
ncbi:hypothetical protein BWQ96_00713 [Gracilariopsis chorda]|uniref:Uncharacterized protein n=1 Tax=Gracilariopsis chorda TaxID=448386 RepID=A0A2V3J5Y3_9FLOR|nr:hypothetical protein BWQ96_00713 [Gracilariopsis chorda]|eukprot:PXF49397.1 hypothetical protein BWQ96_00713 [Gracilariopsis chorda]